MVYIFIIILVFFWPTIAISDESAEIAEPTLLAKSIGYFDGQLFELYIEEFNGNKTGVNPTERKLTIHCIKNCVSPRNYEERFIDMPISAFRLWDGSHEFITIWASGSAYWVRIYNINSERILKVLDEATKSAPQFVYSKDGKEMVILDNPYKSDSIDRVILEGSIWKWSGEKYELSK